MSSVVDNRVVAMEFDNSKFEKNIETSLGTLRHLDDTLNKIDGSSFEKLSGSVEAISNKFTLLGTLSRRIFETMADDVINAGKRMVSGFTIDQMASGWDKYAEKTTSVQTIMSATGDSIEEVTEQLNKLNWFTDETSYNFTDMTSNIAKFTSQGIGLKDAVNEMQGIALWAASAGQNAQAASRAMYNISQAMGAGSMKLIDWRSIQNANMATKEFKEQALEAAVAVGSLVKEGESYVTVAKGTEVTLQNFDQTLSEGWLTSAAMEMVFNRYGMFADVLHELSSASGLTATELLNMYSRFKEGGDIQEEFANELNISDISAEELLATFTELNTEAYALGEKAFRLGQEAKTFGDAMDATADAVSTAWMNLFETIFGNYEQQKKIWTDLSVYMYDWFAEPINNATTILRESMETFRNGISGRELLFDPDFGAFYNLLNIITTIGEVVSRAWGNVFRGNKIDLVYNFIAALQKGTSSVLSFLIDSEEKSQRLERILTGVFSLLNIGSQAITAIFSGARRILMMLGFVGDGVLEGAARFADWITAIDETIKENKIFERGINFIVFGIEKFIEIIKKASVKIKELYLAIRESEKVQQLADWLDKHFNLSLERIPDLAKNAAKWLEEHFNIALAKIPNLADKAAEALLTGFQAVLNFFTTTVPAWYQVIQNYFQNLDFSGILTFFQKVKSAAFDLFKMLKQLALTRDWDQFVVAFSERFPKITEAVQNVKEALQKFFAYIGENGPAFVKKWLTSLLAIVSILLTIKTILSVNKTLDSVSGFLDTLSDTLSGIKKTPKILAIVGMATALIIILYEVKMLAELPPDALRRALVAIGLIGGLLILLTTIVAIASKLDLGVGISAAASGILKIAASLGIIAWALIEISKMPIENYGRSVITLVGIMTALALAAAFMAKQAPMLSIGGSGLIMYALAILMLAKTLKEIQANADNLSIEAFTTLIGIMAALAVMSLVIRNVKFSGALGVLLLAVSLVKIEDALLNAIEHAIPFETFKTYWKELLSIITLLAGFASITRLTGKGSIKGILSLLLLIGLLYLLPGVIEKMGAIPTDQLWKGVTTIVVIGAVLAAVLATISMLAKMTKEGLGTLKWLLIGIAGILLAVYLMRDMTMDQLLPAMTAIGTVMVALGLAIMLAMIPISRASAIDAKAISGLIVILVGIGGVIAALWWLSAQDLPALPQVAYSLAAVMVALGFALFAVGNTQYNAHGFMDAIKTMFQALLLLAPVVAALWAIQYLGIEASISTIAALSLLLVALAGCMALLSLTKTSAGDAVANGAALLVASGALVGIAFALSVMQDINLDGISEKILLLGGVLIELSIVLTVLSLIKNPSAVGTALLGLLGIIGIVGGLMAAFALLGPDNEKMMEVAPRIINGFTLLGEAFGAFFGGFIGGIGVGASIAMIEMAENLGTFVQKLQPFLEATGNITDEQVRGIDALSALILKLAAAEFIDAIANILTGFGLLKTESLGDKLPELASAITDYLGAIKNVSTEEIEKGATITAAFTDLLNALPRTGGIASWIIGDKSLGKFAENIESYGRSLQAFCASITSLSEHDVEQIGFASRITGSVIEIAEQIPHMTGAVTAWFLGDNNAETFGERMQAFLESLVNICNSAAALPERSAVKLVVAKNLTTILGDMAEKIPDVSSWLQNAFIEHSDPKKWGKNMEGYLAALVSITQIEGLDSINGDALKNLGIANALTTTLVTIAEAIPQVQSGLERFLFEHDDQALFGERMAGFIQALITASNAAAALPDQAIERLTFAQHVTETLVGLLQAIPSSSIFVSNGVATTGDVVVLGNATNQVRTFLQYLLGMTQTASTIPENAISTISFTQQVTSSLIELLQMIPSASWFSNNGIANTGDIVVFGNSIKQFAIAMKTYIDEVSGLKTESAIVITEHLMQIATELSEMSDHFKMLTIDVGDVVTSFGSAVDGIEAHCQTILEVITSYAGSFEQAGIQNITAYTRGIASNQNGSIIASVSKVTQVVLAYLTRGNFKDSGSQIVVQYVSGILDNRPLAMNAGHMIVMVALSGLSSIGREASYTYGQYFGYGFVQGIYDQIPNVQTAAASLGYVAAEALAAAAQIRSPSRIAEEKGEYFGEGWIIGIRNLYGAVKNAGEGLAEITIDAVSYAKNAADILLSSDYDPVIRPVVDLSDVENAANHMPSFGGIYSFTSAQKGAEVHAAMSDAYREKMTAAGIKDSVRFEAMQKANTDEMAKTSAVIQNLANRVDQLGKSIDQDRNFNVDIHVGNLAVRTDDDIRAISKQLANEVRVALRQKGIR